ncbi:MAG TPA: hypothetical protein VKY74_12540 [Chloroflexia bacterium]|nr:hypothetical protein [Chloroflexia bacterium]
MDSAAGAPQLMTAIFDTQADARGAIPALQASGRRPEQIFLADDNTGGFGRWGLPAEAVRHYDRYLREGRVLLTLEVPSPAQVGKLRAVLEDAGAYDVRVYPLVTSRAGVAGADLDRGGNAGAGAGARGLETIPGAGAIDRGPRGTDTEFRSGGEGSRGTNAAW